ncbi:MAG: hypothetical protein Q9191_001375 [Dirinaria sp. TL-2023a]
MEVTQFVVAQRDKALLVGDYGSYRTQLSRRLLTVRRKLNYTSVKGHKFLHLLLLTAERAWAQAMHMKSTHSAESGGKAITGSTRRHINSRLRKAAVYVEQLLELLRNRESGATTDNVLEARAYLVSLQGAVEFEKRNWEACLHVYSEARLIYSSLAKSGNAKRDDTFRDLLSTNIDPSIRYAAYQLKLPRTTTIDTIVERYVHRTDSSYVQQILQANPDALSRGGSGQKQGTSGASDNVPKTLRWRSREVKLEDAATAQALAAVSEAEVKLSSFLNSHRHVEAKAKASAYDGVLIPSQDAVDATKTAIDELASEGVPQSDPRMQALQITRTAVNYALIGWRIGRNRVLCGEHDGATLVQEKTRRLSKPRKDGKPRKIKEESNGRKLSRLRERVVLYDATLQSLDSVKDLPGVAADQALIQEIDTKRAYFSALRCLAIARSHALLSNTKNALALFARALEQCPRKSSASPDEGGLHKPPNIEVKTDQTDYLHNLLSGLVAQHRALVELHNLNEAAVKEAESKAKYAPPMVERLDEYPANGVDLTKLVTYPPKLQPIPVKPLFLDVAWNYIDYPGRSKKGTEQTINGAVDAGAGAPPPKKEAKKGWFGFGR